MSNSNDSSSSSSDEDDDLLLSSAPIFSKGNNDKEKRKEKASEKRALNYLDNMLKKGEERLEQQTRIQDICEQEIKGEEEDSNDGKDGQNIDQDGDGSGIEFEGENGTNDDCEDNTKKRKCDNENGGNGNNQKPLLKKASSSVKKINIDNEEYWSKLQSSMSKDSSYVVESDRRRQNLRDAVDGKDVLHMTHHDDDSDDDEDDDEKSESKIGSMALITGRSTIMGTRRLFGVVNSEKALQVENERDIRKGESKQAKFSLFSSYDEAMSELTSIIKFMDKPAPRSLSKKNRSMWNDAKQAVIEPIKNAIKSDLLPLMLEKRKHWVVNSGDPLVIPLNLIRWLIRSSMSGKSVGTEIHCGSLTMMCRIMSYDNLMIFDSDTNVHENSSDEIAYVFQLEDIMSILHQDFGLWLNKGPPPISETQSSRDREKNKNETGLWNSLNMWATAFEMDLVDISRENSKSFLKESWDADDNCICSTTARVVAILCRSSLDPCFHSGKR